MQRSCVSTRILRRITLKITFLQVERKRGKHRTLVSRDEMFPRGKRVTSQTKQVVCNVYSCFEKQAKKGGLTIGPLSRTVKATGLSRATVMPIRSEKGRIQEGLVFATLSHTHKCCQA